MRSVITGLVSQSEFPLGILLGMSLLCIKVTFTLQCNESYR